MNKSGSSRLSRRITVASLCVAAGVVLIAGRFLPGLERLAAVTWLTSTALLITALILALLSSRRASR